MVGVGNLDKKVKLKKRTIVDDGLTQKETFAVDKTVWASVSWVSDRERFAAASVAKDVAVRLIVRKTLIDNTWRVEIDGAEFGIDGIKPIDKQFIEITAGGVRDSQL